MWLHFTNLHANGVKSIFVPSKLQHDESEKDFRDKECFVGLFVEIKSGRSRQIPARVTEMC